MKLTRSQIHNLRGYINQHINPDYGHYGIVELMCGNRAELNFSDHKRYAFIAGNTRKLFCHIDYFGVVLIIEDERASQPVVHAAYVHGNAIALDNRDDMVCIQPIGQNADILWDYELTPDGLTEHFSQTYRLLKQDNPQHFNDELKKLLQMQLAFHVDDRLSTVYC